VYYNNDIHKASLAMPEFFKKAFAWLSVETVY
jgi:spermidine synthase